MLRALGKQEDDRIKPFTAFATFSMSWASVVTVIFVVPDLPTPLKEQIVLVFSVLFAAGLIWAYRLVKIDATKRIGQLLKMLSIVNLSLACVTECYGLYVLYESSYLSGSYDVYVALYETLGVPLPEQLSKLATASQGIFTGIFAVALGTFSIAFSTYSWERARRPSPKSILPYAV